MDMVAVQQNPSSSENQQPYHKSQSGILPELPQFEKIRPSVASNRESQLVDNVIEHIEYQEMMEKMGKLRDMGFYNFNKNVKALKKTNFDVQKAMELLLRNEFHKENPNRKGKFPENPPEVRVEMKKEAGLDKKMIE